MLTVQVALNLIPVEKNSNLIKQVNLLARKIYLPYYSKCINPLYALHTYGRHQTSRAIKKAILSGEEYYIVNYEGNNVGYFAIKVTENENSLFISKLYLDSSVRGKGFGRYTFNYVLTIAKELNLSKIILNVSQKNPTVKIYEKFGFKILKPIYIDEGNGITSEDYLMELEI